VSCPHARIAVDEARTVRMWGASLAPAVCLDCGEEWIAEESSPDAEGVRIAEEPGGMTYSALPAKCAGAREQ
jgi:hypothetical protein